MTKKPIYLDYAATTPVDPRVVETMSHCLSLEGVFGNPASHHQYGKEALEKVEMARKQAADLIHASPRNIIFTSGATESNNLSLKGVAEYYQEKGRHIITAATEHKAVLDTCAHLEKQGFSVSYLQPDKNGLIDLPSIERTLRPDTILVSMMQVNNETGVMQDIRSIAELTRSKGIFFHVDAAQSVGRIPMDLQTVPIDLLSFSGHKIYGPKGIGALYIGDRPRVWLMPQLHGGGQERKLRAGTLATHQIAGLGMACQILNETLAAEISHLQSLQDRLWAGIKDLPQVYLNGDEKSRVPGILSLRFGRFEKEVLLERLQGLAISSASACNSVNLEPSHVLRAMGYTIDEANRSLRFSVGRFTSKEEIDEAIRLIREI